MFSSSLLVLGLLSIDDANAYNPCQSPSTNLHRDIQLTRNERQLVQEMYATKKELRKIKKKYKLFEESWMVDFVSGEIDRSYIEVTMEELYSSKEDKEFELRHLGFELLEGYSVEQREQVIYNMEDTKQCYAKHKIKERNIEIKKQIRPIQTLLQDIELSNEQRQAFEGIRLAKEQQRETIQQDFSQTPEVLFQQFLQGHTDQTTTLKAFEAYSDSYFQFRLARVELLLDLLETLNDEQKKQFLANAEELEKKRKAIR